MSSNTRAKRKKRSDDDGWAARGGYMAAKVQKLTEQVKGDLVKGSKSNIFKGISIFVNGYTKPTAADLKILFVEHGGVFHHYYRRELVSHVIASNLPNSKIANLTDKKVCKPEWITDSVKSERLLPYQDYLLYTSRSDVQPGLCFKPTVNADEKKSSTDALQKSHFVAESNFRNKETENTNEIYDGNSSNKERPSENLRNVNSSKHCENILDENDESDTMSTSIMEPDVEQISKTEGYPKPTVAISPKHVKISPKNFQSPTNASDPKFLSEFFSHSRLHHLSTWGAEFKAYVNELQLQGDNTYPARNKLRNIVESRSGNGSVGQNADNTSRSRLSLSKSKNTAGESLKKTIMHIDMDCFFVSVGIRNRPELLGKPIAVTHSTGKMSTDRPGASLSYERAYYQNKGLQNKKGPRTATGPNTDLDDFDDLEDEKPNKIPEDSFPTEEQTFYSMAEIASCSYEARNLGVKNGMFMGTAKKLCPDIITIPYDFEGYNEVSKILYDTVASYTHDIEAVSCDEMLVDCTDVLADTGATPQEFATLLRQEILEKTNCNASAGMGSSILIARLATRVAKPNGQHYVAQDEVTEFIKDKLIKDLPGVGRTMTNKLQQLCVTTCGDMQKIPLDILKKELGPKTGQSLYSFCRGIDKRPIKMEKERKSVSAEVNYGIRFTQFSEAVKFISGLADEVSSRLVKIGVKGKTVTLKVKVRKKDAPRETAKFLGHGVCDNVAKSSTIAMATDQAKVIAKEALSLVHAMKISAEDFRGIGIQMSRLEDPAGMKKHGNTPSILQFTTNKIEPKISPERRNVDKSLVGVDELDSDLPDKEDQHNTETDKAATEIKNTATTMEHDESHSRRMVKRSPGLPPLPTLPSLSSPETSFSELMTADTHRLSQDSPTVTRVRQLHMGSVDDYVLPSPSQIDPSVLQELPSDIRLQIESALTKKGKPVPSRKASVASGNNDEHTSQEAGCSHWLSQQLVSQDTDQSGKNTEDKVLEPMEAIQALPNFSQIDPSCLAALPKDLRTELEKAYSDQIKTTTIVKPFTEVHPLMRMKTSPNKSPVKSPRKSPGRGKKQSPVFKVPRGRPPGKKNQSLSPKKLEFGNKTKLVKDQIKLVEPSSNNVGDTEQISELEQSPLTSPDMPAPVSLCGAVTLSEVKALMKEWVDSSPAPEVDDLTQFVQYLADLVQDKNLEQVDLLIKYLKRLLNQEQTSAWKHGAQFILRQTQGIIKATYGALLAVPSVWQHIS